MAPSRSSTPAPSTPSKRQAAATSPSKATRSAKKAAAATTAPTTRSQLATSGSAEDVAKKAGTMTRPTSGMSTRSRTSNNASKTTATSASTRATRARPNSALSTSSASSSTSSRASSPTKRSTAPSDTSLTEGSETDDFESCASASEAEREGDASVDVGGSDTETEVDQPTPPVSKIAIGAPRRKDLEAVVAEGSSSAARKTGTALAPKKSRLALGEAKDGKSENVVVCVRVRPRPSSSMSDIDSDSPDSGHKAGTWNLDPSRGRISLSDKHPIIERRGTGTSESVNGSEGYSFEVDQVFPPSSDTAALYTERVSPVVRSAMEGFNGTVFAYGQTGSGKTFTMMGSNELPGVIPQAIEEMFEVIREEGDAREFLLRVSYLEIYNETLRDLLDPDGTAKLDIRVDKGRVQVSGLKEEVVTHPMQVLDTIARGERARHVGATDWNERSSRSHTVFSMTIESRERTSSPDLAALAGTSGLPSSPSLHKLASASAAGTRVSSLNLIDLAGSESAASSSERRKEGAFINKSLLALGTVIAKLTERGGGSTAHIPYRDSKLTRLLQTSLGGNAKVAVICTISPDAHHAVESVSTLRFARRAKMVVTKAERGTTLDSQSALLQKYQQEILELRSRLLANEASLDDSLAREKDEETRRLDGLKDERKRAEEDIAEMQLQRIRLQEQIEHLNRRILTSKSVDANVRRASLENGSDGSMTPARRGRISDIGIGPSPLGGGIMDVGLRKSGSRGRLSNILEAVGSPRVGTVEKEAALEKELEELRQTSQKELAAKNDRIQELEHGLETTNARLESATSEAQTARSSLLEQEQQLATVRTSVLALESSLDRLQKEKQDLVEEQDQTKDVTSSQADKVARLEAKVGDLARLLDSANAEKTTVTASAEEKGARLLVLEAEARELRLGLSDVTSARDLDVKQLERRTEELEAERATVVSLQTQLADAVAAAKSVSAGLEAQVAAAQGERDQARQEVQGLNIKLAEVEKLVTAVQDEAKKASTDLAMQSETKRQELETKRQELETTQAENRTLKIDLEDIRGQLARLQDQQRHSIQVTSLSSSRGPNTDGLKAKLAALQKKQNGTASEPASAPGSSGSTSSPSENVESAVELQAMVEEQKTRIKKLETDLMDARRQATEALAKDLAHLSPARPRPSSYASSPGRTELQHTKSLKETPQRDRHQTAESRRTTAAAEEEIDRLNEVIKSQKNMLSDARTDMAKWQAKLRAQAEIIAQLQADSDMPSTRIESPLSSPIALLRREHGSPSKTKMSAPPLVRTNSIEEPRGDGESPFARAARTFTPEHAGRGSQPSSPSKANDYLYRGLPFLEGSPKPLPTPPRIGGEDEKAARKSRRVTIENDIEKLKQGGVVERKKSVLLSPKSSPVKSRRVLSGLGIRAAKMSAEDRPLSPWEESPVRARAADENEAAGKKRSTDAESWYE